MQFVSGINKTKQIPTPTKKVFSIPDETIQNPLMEQLELDVPVELSREQFKEVRKTASNIIESTNKISDKDKEYLQALLGFGVATEKVNLYQNGIKYTFVLRNFNDSIVREFANERLLLEEELGKILADQTLTEEQKKEVNLNYIFSIRLKTLKFAIQEIIIGEPLNKSFSKEQLIESLNLSSFEELLESWGEDSKNLLYEKYSSFVEKIKQNLTNPQQLSDNLKK